MHYKYQFIGFVILFGGSLLAGGLLLFAISEFNVKVGTEFCQERGFKIYGTTPGSYRDAHVVACYNRVPYLSDPDYIPVHCVKEFGSITHCFELIEK